MSKADEKALSGLHGKLAEILQEAITQDYGVDDMGVKVPPPAAILNVARQFLKDNKIEAVAAPGTPLHDLADLPVFEDDNIIPIRKSS
jgi:hypothetical protein